MNSLTERIRSRATERGLARSPPRRRRHGAISRIKSAIYRRYESLNFPGRFRDMYSRGLCASRPEHRDEASAHA
ncbi:hypothetical protein EVAR_7672_1 [Eumeta japonica]|uniref:Uncharacterized protein n=1 Tax=Eumeta variegata TaxID=151549 RepID=A0A4C1TKW5_EUMVA|nr:hypothetical protein EVAR_7672_1 [Eumeta japonica]